MSPALLADAVLVLHAAVVAFVVLGQVAIVAGGLARRGFARNRGFRIAHLALVGVIVVQAWLGRLCPLTTLEQSLREAAGLATHGESFVEYWLSRALFFEAPWWVFVAAYTAFGVLVAASWVLWPPHPRARR